MTNKFDYATTLATIRRIWNTSFGVLTAFILSGLWVSPVWMPVVGAALVFILIRVRVIYLTYAPIGCSLLIRYAVQTIVWSSLIMLAINLLNTRWIDNIFVDQETYNISIPYIPSLIVYPVLIVVLAVGLMRMGRSIYCRRCMERAGMSFRDGVHRNIHQNEARLQTKFLLTIAIFMSVLSWAYYMVFYINVNLNESDVLYYFILPVAIYLLSVGYMISRYGNMQLALSAGVESVSALSKSQIRFLVVRADRMLLTEVPLPGYSGHPLWDTPACAEVSSSDNVADESMRQKFAQMAGTDSFSLRRLFVTAKMSSTPIYHFAVFLDSPDVELPGLSGTWLDLYAIDALLKSGSVSRPLAFEIHRIYTVTMAWKTYDRDGRRLYPIKNYRPTFRLSDFHSWDVDYDDNHWLDVANNNQDRMFYRLRRLYRRFISGSHPAEI